LEAEANKFKDDVEQAEFEDDNDNRISFGGKAILQTERTAAQKRALKRKAGAEARGGASSLNGDQIQQAFNYLNSDERRVEDRAEKQRDREHQERRIVQQMMYIQQGSSSNTSMNNPSTAMQTPTTTSGASRFCGNCAHAVQAGKFCEECGEKAAGK
jgi:hypothetical protein